MIYGRNQIFLGFLQAQYRNYFYSAQAQGQIPEQAEAAGKPTG